MIMGGQHLRGTSKKAMERYAREAKGQPLTNVLHLTQRPPKRFKGETDDITFTEEDAQWVHHPHSDSLVIKVGIGARNVHQVLCDCGSAVNILSYDAYQKMGLQDKDLLPTITHVYGFTGDAARVKGMVKLPITLGEEPRIATQIHEFTVVDHSAGYNAIIGIPIMKEMRMVLSIYHLTMKFPTPHGTGKIRGCQYDSRDCYNKALKIAEKKNQHPPGHDMEILTVEGKEGAQRDYGPNEQGGSICNVITIEEVPNEDKGERIVYADPVPGALMMTPSQPRRISEEGIVEEASDDEAIPPEVIRHPPRPPEMF